jgi:hypothetical protein
LRRSPVRCCRPEAGIGFELGFEHTGRTNAGNEGPRAGGKREQRLLVDAWVQLVIGRPDVGIDITRAGGNRERRLLFYGGTQLAIGQRRLWVALMAGAAMTHLL